MDKPDSVVLQ